MREIFERYVVAAGVVALIATAAAQPAAAGSRLRSSHKAVVNPAAQTNGRDFFRIPGAAYRHPLGEFPANGPCSATDLGDPRCSVIGATGVAEPAPFANANPASQPGLGVPLGGVGAGAFMVNQAGTFGPWDFGGDQDVNFENRIVPQAAFHVREQLGGGAARARTLAVQHAPWAALPAAWRGQALKPGQGTYAALYPFGWTTYDVFHADVSMRFWSPIVADDDRQTSMPIGFFDVRIANHTRRTDRLSVMFTMPNVAEHLGGYWQLPAGKITPTVRKGLSSRFERDARSGVAAVTMSSDSPADTADAKDSDWTLAARPRPGQQLSYTTSWRASGAGADVIRPFDQTGRLPDRAIDHSHSAGALAVSVRLRPGQVSTIPFALAWDFPQVTFNPGVIGQHLGLANAVLGHLHSAGKSQTWMRRYTAFFGARETSRGDYVSGSYPGHRGFAIADEELSHHAFLLRRVNDWWRPIVNRTAYPAWLKREALNELYQMVWNDSFWESGLVAATPSTRLQLGAAVPGTHLFCARTGGGWTECNEWDTDIYGYLTYDAYWPHLERDLLRAAVQEIRQGELPTIGTMRTGSLDFQDVPMKTIFRIYAYYLRTHDAALLRYAYPAMVKLYKYLKAGIPPTEHLPIDYPGQSSTYDLAVVVGHGIYNSEQWLLTQEVMIRATRIARRLGVAEASLEFERSIERELPAAKAEFERVFWDPVAKHYRIDAVGSYDDGYFVDTFFAQHLATTWGLPPLVDAEREDVDLRNAYPHLMQLKDRTGHYLGPPIVVPGSGAPFPAPCPNEICEVWQGSADFAAATYVGEGKRLHDPTLIREGLQIGHAIEYQTTENVSNGYLFDPPESWDADSSATYRSPGFNRARAALDLMNSIETLPRGRMSARRWR